MARATGQRIAPRDGARRTALVASALSIRHVSGIGSGDGAELPVLVHPKTGARNRAEALRIASERGWL